MSGEARETLPLLYRDDFLVAVHKPAGLLVHRSNIDRHETRFALQIVRDQIGQRVYPVHRLDKGTSGVLLFALDESTARDLGKALMAGAVAKTYRAVVRGWIADCGVIDHPLARQDDQGVLDSSPSGDCRENLQAAVTRFRRIARSEIAERVEARQAHPTTRYSLVELYPETGRQHQLRRHMKHLSHPIIGDSTYGKGVQNRFFAERFGVARLCLACRSMAFSHPRDQRILTIDARPEEDFNRLLEVLSWRFE